MGIPGAGKTRLAEDYVARGYSRLNRDERGGSLRDLARALDEQLGTAAQRLVLDNTWLTRAARSHVIDAASRYGIPTRCTWIDIALSQAQVNVVERILELRFSSNTRGVAHAGSARAGDSDADRPDARASRARGAGSG
jgi:predicted kinase